jgi:predicted CopG family antitoxin
MVKTVHIPLDDKVYDDLVKSKGDKNWEDFIKTLIKNE